MSFSKRPRSGQQHQKGGGGRDLVEEALPGENEPEKVERVRYNYGIIIESDATENRQKEMLDLCQIACEKYAAAEKSPTERNNFRAAEMIKESLDRKLGGPYNVVVGESFSLEIDYVKSTLFYMYFGGYLAVLIWKCV